MTIALVANSSWNLHHFRRSLIRRLLAEGYHILLLAPEDSYTPRLGDLADVRFVPLRQLQAERKNPLRELLLLRELYRIYRRERPDLILHFTIKPNLYGSLAAGWLGIPSIATVTGLGYTFIHDRASHRMVRMLYRFAFQKSTRVVFQNPDDRTLFLELGLVEKGKNLLIPGSGVDTDYYTPWNRSRSAGVFVFLFVGRLLFDKGIQEFYEAARRLRELDCAFWVLGKYQTTHPNGVPEKTLDNWLAGGEIEYLGYRDDVRPLLGQADVLVLPSHGGEGIPRSVLEAMSMAKPILATDVPGSRETVEPGQNGLLVPARSVEALAEAMQAMQSMDRALLAEWGRNSRRLVVEKFSQKVVNDLYIEIIKKLNTSDI
jgi:glycosyltransferase involved in cell wall biosynthesis